MQSVCGLQAHDRRCVVTTGSRSHVYLSAVSVKVRIIINPGLGSILTIVELVYVAMTT